MASFWPAGVHRNWFKAARAFRAAVIGSKAIDLLPTENACRNKAALRSHNSSRRHQSIMQLIQTDPHRSGQLAGNGQAGHPLPRENQTHVAAVHTHLPGQGTYADFDFGLRMFLAHLFLGGRLPMGMTVPLELATS